MERYRLKEFSQIVGISQYILRKMNQTGEFKGIKIGNHPLFYTQEHVELFNHKFMNDPELKEFKNESGK